MFPRTKFKKPIVMNIVGAGDVVEKKMLPALLKEGTRLTPEHLSIYTLIDERNVPDHRDYSGVRVDSLESESEIIKRLLESDAPTIIATPSEHHFSYMSSLQRAGMRFAVEKPISILPAEIDAILTEIDRFSASIFSLSYYGLEKALPVSYVLAPNYHFEGFLTISGDSLTGQDKPTLRFDCSAYLEELGPLRSLQVDLLEGVARSPTAEARAWTEISGTRGLAFETMIHPLIVLSKFLRQQEVSLQAFQPDVITGTSMSATNPRSATYLHYSDLIPREAESIEVELSCGKYIPEADLKRSGLGIFENGCVEFDFDSQSCSIRLNSGKAIHIAVAKRFTGKYDIQMNLVRKFFQEGFYDVRYDDLEDQLAVLSWLRRHQSNVVKSFVY